MTKAKYFSKAISLAIILCISAGMIFTGNPVKADVPITSYNAVAAVEGQVTKGKGAMFDDAQWSYEEKAIALNEETGLYYPTGDWKSKKIYNSTGWCSNSSTVRNALPNMFFAWDDGYSPGRGLAVYKNRVITTVGFNNFPAPSLTFTAPKSGSIRLYDPNDLTVGSSGIDSGYAEIGKNNDGTANPDEKVGFAIYLNNKKIWPAESDYYILTPDNKSVAFPDLYNINVDAGDKLRMMFVPLYESRVYIALAPQVDYLSENAYTTSFDAYSAVEGAKKPNEDWEDFIDAVWDYEEADVALDEETGLYLSQNNWADVVLEDGTGWCSTSEAVNSALPNMFFKWSDGDGHGIATYNNRVVTFVGHKVKKSPSITFVAPNTGTVKLYDPNNSGIVPTSVDAPFYTLDGDTEQLGFAIYKNNEKIWPADEDYYTLTKTNNRLEFPVIDDLAVTKGDRIRFTFIPIANSWGYMSINPAVTYKSITGIGWEPTDPIAVETAENSVIECFEDELAYDFSNAAINLRTADGNTVALINGGALADTLTVTNAPMEKGNNVITLQYSDGNYIYTTKATARVRIYGDLDDNGVIDTADLVNVAKYLIDRTREIDFKAANIVKTDDEINIIDLIRMKKLCAE